MAGGCRRMAFLCTTNPVHHQQCRLFSSSSISSSSQHPVLTLSHVVEPPLDSQVLEKPCTVILMEDAEDFRAHDKTAGKGATLPSWRHVFERKIPSEYGMSFGYFSTLYQQEQNTGSLEGRRRELKIIDCVQAMKDASVPHDSILVTRGWFSSACALYYLESLPLQGLVMVNPLSFHSDDATDMQQQQLVLSGENHLRFETVNELKLEPNAVPMLVLCTLPEPSWHQAAIRVAERHSDPDGPYGMVPYVSFHYLEELEENAKKRWGTVFEEDSDVWKGVDCHPDVMIRMIDQWIDEDVL